MTIAEMTTPTSGTGDSSDRDLEAHRDSSAPPGAAVDDLPPPPRWEPRKLLMGWPGLLLALTGIVVIGRIAFGGNQFPTSISVPLDRWLDDAIEWITTNGAWFFQPIADQLNTGFDAILTNLEAVPAPTIVLTLVALVYVLAGWQLGLFAAITVTYVVAGGLWDETIQTLVLLVIAVLACCVIGIAIGVVAASNRRLYTVVTIVLDGMQSFPTFAYLVPVVAVFGTGIAAALVVTIIWAVPPVARMTAVGLSTVSVDTVEAARASGASPLQILRQVRIPLAKRSIVAGVSQTIMFSMTMATIAVLIGAPGLGNPIWGSLGRLEFGQALQAGIALVLLAALIDRTSAVLLARSRVAHPDAEDTKQKPLLAFARRHRDALGASAIVVAASAVIDSVPTLLYADFESPWSWLEIDMRDPVNDAVDWMTLHWASAFDSIRNTVQENGLNPLTSALHWAPWQTVVVGGLVLGYFAAKIPGALIVAGGTMLIGSFGLWEPTIDTLAVCGVAVILALAIAFPTGVIISRSDTLERIVRPVLDTIQTLPIFLFVIPTVVILGSGSVAGTLATTLYAIPVMVRLTNVALRDTDPAIIEAATSSGATERQILLGVRVPLGMPTLLVGINQTILMALAMAVVSAFIGTPGLGEQILTSVTYAETGAGIQSGVAMFILAIMADRVITGLTRRSGAVHHIQSS